ncbi:MAG: AraC-like DNA-binding protein [Bermanella sp.]|jgi:AraC-like DNA-binding protein
MTSHSLLNKSITAPVFINSANKELGILASNIKPLIKLLVINGVELNDLLKGTDIQLSDFLDLSNHITFDQYFRLIKNARLYSVDPTYALKLGEQFFINNDSILACRVMSSKNTQQAMTLLSKYQTLLSGFLDLDFKITDEFGILTINEKFPLSGAYSHFVEYSLSAVFSIGKFCLGEKDLQVTFEFERDDQGAKPYFESFLKNSVNFNCAHNRVLISLKTLQKSIIFADAIAAEKVEKLCELHVKKLISDTEVIQKVKSTIRNMPFKELCLEIIADRMHMSPRTLRRQLQAQGVSFKLLFENERKSIALKRIERQDISLEKLADLLGYNSASSLSRAFKRWFGVSPNHYKKD